ncbi:hypothetical protein FP2506_04731 [Fulvimarina pelagi HTCC2506]|uniref:Zinc-finger protein n=2 Tax=Fulvimarina pelagi TaxID=217511 RepID=Q0FZT6_9HYPH|nr:DUF983 domain-containing protein [Fulvimarina pelagi]EAU40505.1 hypothetical protein FP2506_04731 [Fulvimarina pelagi HTCC2506]BAT31530.1 hypothetical protein [Fulvimarina pelagi]
MSEAARFSASSSAIASANDLSSERNLGQALLRGLRCRCPNCGEGKLFGGFVKSVNACEACGQEIYHHRADDLPPYLTIFIVGHLIVALFMGLEAAVTLSIWTHMAIWIPVTVVLSLLLMQPLKGATIGLQWALRLGGFGGETEEIG